MNKNNTTWKLDFFLLEKKLQDRNIFGKFLFNKIN